MFINGLVVYCRFSLRMKRKLYATFWANAFHKSTKKQLVIVDKTRHKKVRFSVFSVFEFLEC